MAVENPRKVSWLLILVGLFTAAVTGVVIGFFAAAGSTRFFAGDALPAAIVVTVVVALIYFTIYWFTRRPAPDFALGLLIGGCLVAIVSGACGGLMSAMTYS